MIDSLIVPITITNRTLSRSNIPALRHPYDRWRSDMRGRYSREGKGDDDGDVAASLALPWHDGYGLLVSRPNSHVRNQSYARFILVRVLTAVLR